MPGYYRLVPPGQKPARHNPATAERRIVHPRFDFGVFPYAAITVFSLRQAC